MILDGIIKNAELANGINENDYKGDNGLYYCGKCRTPKQRVIELRLQGKMVVPISCDCKIAARKAEEETRKAELLKDRRKEAFSGSTAINNTFSSDDSPETELSKICRTYATSFDSAKSKWLLFYGGCGVGKSYMAACIVNEIISAGYTAKFTNVSEIEQLLWNAESKKSVYTRLSLYDLLVLDDLSTERSTSYMNEILFNVIDGRLISGRPAIITTNLTAQEIVNPSDLSRQRIFSRLYEKSIPVKVDGADRRLQKMKECSRTALDDLLNL